MDFSDFDWEEAFRSAKEHLHTIMREHGYLGVEEYREYLEELYGDLEKDLPGWCLISNDWVAINPSEVVDSIIGNMVDMYEDAALHDDLRELYEKCDHWECMEEKEKVALFDALIDAEHHTGSIWGDVDIESMREEFEEEALELREEALMI